MNDPRPIRDDIPLVNTAEEYDPASDPNLKRAQKWCPRCRREYEGYVWAARVPVAASVERQDEQGRVIGICGDCAREVDAEENRRGRGRHGWLGQQPRELQPPQTTFGERDDD